MAHPQGPLTNTYRLLEELRPLRPVFPTPLCQGVSFPVSFSRKQFREFSSFLLALAHTQGPDCSKTPWQLWKLSSKVPCAHSGQGSLLLCTAAPLPGDSCGPGKRGCPWGWGWSVIPPPCETTSCHSCSWLVPAHRADRGRGTGCLPVGVPYILGLMDGMCCAPELMA